MTADNATGERARSPGLWPPPGTAGAEGLAAFMFSNTRQSPPGFARAFAVGLPNRFLRGTSPALSPAFPVFCNKDGTDE